MQRKKGEKCLYTSLEELYNELQQAEQPIATVAVCSNLHHALNITLTEIRM